MAYDIFSQPQGPNIDTSLFVNAADRGYRTGYDIGSTLSNAVEGAVSGYRQGQAIYSESQQQQLRQAQIEDIPLDRAYKQEQLEALKRDNELKARAAEQERELAALKKKAATTELENKIDKQGREIADRKEDDALFEALKTATPADLLGIYSRYGQALARNKEAQQIYAAKVEATPEDFFPSGFKKGVLLSSGLARVGDFYDEKAAKAVENYKQAEAAFTNDPITKAVAQRLKIPTESVADKVIAVPAGTYRVDESDNVIFERGSPAVNPKDTITAPADTLDIFSVDDKGLPRKRVLSNQFSGAPGQKENFRTKQSDFVDQRNLQTGTQKRWAQREYTDNFNKHWEDSKKQQTPTAAPAQIPTQAPAQISAPLQPEDPVTTYSVTFGLPQESLEKHRELINKLDSKSPYAGDFETAKRDLAKIIAKEEFDFLGMEKSYTDRDVEYANRANKITATQLGLSPDNWKLGPWEIKTKEDLYYNRNAASIMSKIQAILDTKKSQETQIAAKPTIKQAGNKDFLAKMGAYLGQ